MSCYLVQEIDGVGRFTLEDGTGFLLLDNCVPSPPSGGNPAGGVPRGRRKRLEVINAEDEWLAVILSEM